MSDSLPVPGDRAPSGAINRLDPLPDDDITAGEQEGAIQALGHKLLPWQRTFARWLAGGKVYPRRNAQFAKLKELRGFEVSDVDRRELIRHPAFRAYFQIFQDRGIRAARARMEEVSLEAVNTLTWAMRKSKQKDDYRAVPNIVSPILERAMPRRDSIGMQQAQVTVVLTTQQLQDLDQPQPVIEAQIIDD